MPFDKSYQPSGGNYQAQGGKLDVIGGILDFEGGVLQVAGATQPGGLTITPAAGATNVCNASLQVTDHGGNALAGVFDLDIWLSDAATGAGVTATTASGTVAAAAASGYDITDYTAKKFKRVQTKADGTYVLAITDTAKTHFYVAWQVPGLGSTVVSAQLLTANYG